MKLKVNKDSMKFKIIAFVIFALFIIGLTIALIPLIKMLKTSSGREHLAELIVSYRAWGIVIFLVIQTLQVIVALIPPIQIIGGMLFGGFLGGVLSVAGVWLGSAAVFGLVKLFGKPLVEAIVDQKHIGKFKIFQDGERLEHIFFILFLIPGTPKDSLAYLVPLTNIDFKKFMLYVFPARIPAIVFTSFIGSSIRGGHPVATAILVGIFVTFAVLGLVFRERIINWLKRKKEQFSQKVSKNKGEK